jgi:hypothetical protein
MATQAVKDILDTEIPKPTWVLSPSRAAPLPTIEGPGFSRSSTGWTFDSARGKFTPKEAGTPRINGTRNELLVEARRENQVTYSSGDTNWGYNYTAVESIMDESGADGLRVEGQDQGADNVGSFTGNRETFSVIVEKIAGSETLVRVKNSTTGDNPVFQTFDWASDSWSGGDTNSELLTQSGPNGGEVRRLIARYSGTQGDMRTLVLEPNGNSASNSDVAVVHHHQLEEAPFATSPIYTSGGKNTREKDNLIIWNSDNYPEWFNTERGTWIFEIRPLFEPGSGDESIVVNSDRGANNEIIGIDTTSSDYLVVARENNDGIYLSERQTGSRLDTLTVATTYGQSEKRVAINGSVTTGDHAGNHLAPSKLTIARQGASRILRGTYRPAFLSEEQLRILTQ